MKHQRNILSIVILSLVLFFTGCKSQKQEQQDAKRQAMVTRLKELSINDPNGYKSVRWGMSLSEVQTIIKKETGDKLLDASFPVGKGAYMQYTPIAGVLSTVVYNFSTKGLCMVIVFYDQNLMNVNNSTVNDYDKLEGILSEKYGQPISEEKTATAESIALGDGECTATWAFPDTNKLESETFDVQKDVNTLLVLKLGKSQYRFLDGIVLSAMYGCPRMMDNQGSANYKQDF